MHFYLSAVVFIFMGYPGLAQSASPTGVLPPQTTLPIVFTRNVDAAHAHSGDRVYAKTTQRVTLPAGRFLPRGTPVAGHVLAATPFVFDKTPYARQKESMLAIHFDTAGSGVSSFALRVYVRALADPLASQEARMPDASDVDPWETVTQIGGDRLIPSQKGVLSPEGDIVEYNRHDGVYAHLIAASGNSPGGCDSSDTEQSMNIFSASACGLYGYINTELLQTGKTGEPSTLTLVSHRYSPKIRKNSTALLEVLPSGVTVAKR